MLFVDVFIHKLSFAARYLTGILSYSHRIIDDRIEKSKKGRRIGHNLR